MRLLPLLLLGCALDNTAPDGGANLDVDIGTIHFHVASGAARTNGATLTLYLTDQPDGCLAVNNATQGTATIFWLRVPAQSTGSATVPGQAAGAIATATGGVQTAGYDAASGSVAWSANADGSYTLVALDVGFAGIADRLRVGGVTIPPCP